MNKPALALAGLGLVYIIYRGSKMLAVDDVRGMRNKNPMNVVKTNIQWDGKTEGEDPTFETFKTYSYGIRAGAKLLVNYQKLYGINTVQGLINRYAPSHENPTSAYINHVAAAVGVAPDQPIDVQANLYKLVAAIIKFEIGAVPFSAWYIKNSIKELTA
ncbi:structural protein [Marinomonas piezotolerans]|uniref:Structural protein n=1 Tax=Marinomonas piezotolerans TaxID=2213058 RepID=A0A370U7G9_9GAMM|nr:structural protein [Marinomonas piezotolerans]RDL43721.1 structural protein [Marinomonas piezotolerans]